MKVLHLDLYYQLPDDFTGTYEDAILYYLEYRRSKGYNPNMPYAKDLPSEGVDLWNEFWNAIHTTQFKSALSSYLVKLNTETNEWINLLDPVGG